jgi:hypothetical protein
MFRAASAHSKNPAGAEAAAECIAQLEGAGVTDPDFVIVHANCAIGLDMFGRALHARWPTSRLHAATSCLGGMTDVATAMAPEAGIGLLAISDPTGDYGVAAGPLAGDARATGQRLAREALARAGRAGEVPALVLVCATPGDEEEFLAGVQAGIGPGVPIIGGSAADNTIAGHWRVLDADNAIADAALVSVLFPSVTVSTAFESGYAPSECRGTITRATGRRIFEIDGQPAADVYERWTEGAVRRPATGGVNILMKSALTPLGRVASVLEDMPLYVLSHPETIVADGSMTLFTRVSEGDEVVLMKGTATTLVGRAGSVVRSAALIGDIDPSEISALAMYYCGGCMLQVRNRLDEMRQALAKEFPGVPATVGFTFGEQGSLALGSVRHGNLMISAIVFGR